MYQRTNTSSAAGTTPTMNNARQPNVGMIVSDKIAAIARPSGNAARMLPAIRPRIRPGLNSDDSVAVTGTSPPSPKFEKKRKTPSDRTFQDAATKPVNTAKIPTVAENAVRRPI